MYNATTIDVVIVQVLRLYDIFDRLYRMVEVVHDDILVEKIIIYERE